MLITEQTTPQLHFLAKILDGEHVESFLSGKLLFRAASCFTTNFQNETSGRNDPLELLTAQYQPEHVKICVGNHEIGGILGPIRVSADFRLKTYIHCMVGVSDHQFNAGGGALRLHPDLIHMGNHAIVIINLQKFLERVSKEIQRRPELLAHPFTGSSASGFVEYVDLDNYHGDVGPFKKKKSLSFQSEWRIAVVDSRESAEYSDYFYLDIGDIHDICADLPTTELLQSELKVLPRT